MQNYRNVHLPSCLQRSKYVFKLIKHFWLFQCRHLLHESGPIREMICYFKNERLKQTGVRFQ